MKMPDFLIKRKPYLSGFSLTEMMTSVALMGILAGIGAPMYLKYKHDANINKMNEDSRVLANKIRMCFRYAELHAPVLSDRVAACKEGEKIGLIPCGKSGAMAVSTSCSTLKGTPDSNGLCVDLKHKDLNGCVRYNPTSREFTVCVNPEASNRDPGCSATCDPKKGYKCDSGFQCVCA